ncbi:MAG: hypothetical protein PHW18_03620 [Sulfuricurvum sp.]|uniref:hypothetical protein n=1 Tax=Sulfuricurvum sp. TaxID=2025608 RepID=UPI002616F577|nr:hypothetical protein [Sulfuricurvum sp.]MDD2828647.1 hypothetical protein [Sulfuricurvum sp.]MDD4948324.1 hypothetical protein [Sulfuricurvum sp.]
MKFIIVSGGYDDNSGGIVVLHQLCDRLNTLGHEAYLWPFFKPALDVTSPFKTLYLFLRYFRKGIKYGFKKNPKLNTPTASYDDLEDAVVIYPEVVVGNPLKAQNVVRWLLHKPGFNNGGKIDFGANDLFFYYDKAFDDSRYNKFPENHLHIVSQRSDVYNVTNNGTRKGSCYLLRKGYKRELVHDITGTRLVDGLSHEETAKVFNEVEYCISYDTHTMYNVYAVMCGCIPIVIPEDGISKDQWQPNEENRYGIAYGFDDIEYAIQTRPLLLQYIKKQEGESNESVIHFVEKCEEYFSSFKV